VAGGTTSWIPAIVDIVSENDRSTLVRRAS
jgi:hypothetical protein